MNLQYLIGVDLGTSGTKTVLFDVHGKEIASALVEYPMYQRISPACPCPGRCMAWC